MCVHTYIYMISLILKPFQLKTLPAAPRIRYLHAPAHTVQPCVNKKTRAGFNVQKINRNITWGYKDANRDI